MVGFRFVSGWVWVASGWEWFVLQINFGRGIVEAPNKAATDKCTKTA